jgi:hypothetical protein
MPYLVNTPIQFVIIIKETSTVINEVDVMFTAPDHTVDYYNGGNGVGAVYKAPSPTSEGSYTFTRSFTQNGTWNVTLTYGNSTDYTIIRNLTINIKLPEDVNTSYNATISFP